MERCQVLEKSTRLVFPRHGGQFAVRRSYHRQRGAESVRCRCLILDGLGVRQSRQRSPGHHDVPHVSTNDLTYHCRPTRRLRRRFAHPRERDGAVSAANPTVPSGWTVTKYACEGGYAIVEVYLPFGRTWLCHLEARAVWLALRLRPRRRYLPIRRVRRKLPATTASRTA